LIRGQRVQDAVTVLTQTPKRASGPVGKVLASAVANAENNHNASARNLVIESVLVGPGPTLKRFRPRAQGRAFPIRKRTSHITVVLRDEEIKTKSSKAATKASSTDKTEAAKSVAAAELASSDSPRSQAALAASATAEPAETKTDKANKEAK
ncbi:MAG TPA: 50S ribosomal protein L22, partial [Candidatus Saccharimonadales bacterium]|nr:50S ribosomal protein L22 [Candidatus Saccharimonadales bacterium]